MPRRIIHKNISLLWYYPLTAGKYLPT